MRQTGTWVLASWLLAAWPVGSPGGEIPNGPAAFALGAAAPLDERDLARLIDRAMEARWASAGVTPALPADDAEFLRRVSLDLAGRIPPASEAREFLDSRDPGKRRKLVDRLLAGHPFANHLTRVWSDLLVPEARGNVRLTAFTADFEAWLRTRFHGGAGFDAVVRELLTAPTQGPVPAPVINPPDGRTPAPTPFAFVAAKEGKPENLAASAARLFLGLRLECAQCHDHPFARWKREEFWGLAAFFAGMEPTGRANVQFAENPSVHRVQIAGTKRYVDASFLDGREVDWPKGVGARQVFANWVTAQENPYFARAAANRVWAQMFGVGLVDPVDDMTGEPSHPEVLDLLAGQLAAHGFDLRYLFRAVASTRAYQLSSAGGSPSGDVYRLFERMPVRGLSAAQLYDSLLQATGLQRDAQPAGVVVRRDSPAADFLELFTDPDERPNERQTSILQALTLLNGRLIDDATRADRGPTLAGVADAYFLDTAGRVEALYLAALSRRPRADELERVVPYVERGGPTLDPRQGLADVFWSLLVSAEFMFNH
jgi:hypothetical protein